MGTKSNYFRHSFEAHNDPKIRRLILECGAKGYAVYFVLLEVYCAKIRDDDSRKMEQEIDLKVIGSYLGVRSDFVHRCIIVSSKLNLLLIYNETMYKLQKTMIKLSIPNSLKYYGNYRKVSDDNFPYKKKGNKIKENKINTSPTASADGLAPQEILHPVKKSRSHSDEKKLVAKSVRENYISAYQNRYGVKPTWAAKENSLALKLIERIGQQESLELSQKYLTYQDPWHCQQKHPFGLLVSQLDKIRVELNNPLRMLDSQIAKTQINTQAEKSQKEISQEKIIHDFLNQNHNNPEEIDYDQK